MEKIGLVKNKNKVNFERAASRTLGLILSKRRYKSKTQHKTWLQRRRRISENCGNGRARSGFRVSDSELVEKKLSLKSYSPFPGYFV